jgi:sulfatase-modifying factor enzyme 1
MRTRVALVALALAAGILAPTVIEAQLPTSALPFIGITPCRLVDTRGNGFSGPFGPPSLPAGVPRDFPLVGQCGLPAEAKAVSLNVTAANTLGPGFFTLYPQGGSTPLVSTLNYLANETIANAALVPLGPGGLTVVAGVSGADLILDVNGYFVELATSDVCAPSSVPVGAVCVDKYEASVWETTDAAVIAKIRAGTVTLAELQAAGAVQRGAASDDYGAGCPDSGNGCVNFYAVSIAGVTPSRFVTWTQAAAAARNAKKRLLTNAEWQAAALGTPDAGPPCVIDPGNTQPGPTGTAGCVSDTGVFDMVGNVSEWVADWFPRSTACPPNPFGLPDYNCIGGADTLAGPGALWRGGAFSFGTNAGVFAISSENVPSFSNDRIGFRAAR